ncbi:MAG: hypothetical protein RJA52_1266, partial [Bacteroidota bacterium]
MPLTAQRNCGTMDVLATELAQNPGLQAKMDSMEKATQEILRTISSNGVDETFYIPVVVHILYNTTAQNISDEQILSQIRILNEDFRRTNPDKNNTPSVFQSVAADVKIEFRLATLDP